MSLAQLFYAKNSAKQFCRMRNPARGSTGSSRDAAKRLAVLLSNMLQEHEARFGAMRVL